MLQLVLNFINYWYFRYLLVTELYMVEKWERAMFHIIVLILVSILYLFNTTVVMGLATILYNSVLKQEAINEEYVYKEL